MTILSQLFFFLVTKNQETFITKELQADPTSKHPKDPNRARKGGIITTKQSRQRRGNMLAKAWTSPLASLLTHLKQQKENKLLQKEYTTETFQLTLLESPLRASMHTNLELPSIRNTLQSPKDS